MTLPGLDLKVEVSFQHTPDQHQHQHGTHSLVSSLSTSKVPPLRHIGCTLALRLFRYSGQHQALQVFINLSATTLYQQHSISNYYIPTSTMARKSQYHREIVSQKPSADGRGLVVTERDVRCTGSDCRHCESERYSRRPSKLDFTSSSSRNKIYSSVDDRLPTPYQFDFRPDPAAKQRRREKSSSDRDRYYIDGNGFTLSRSTSTRGASKPIPIPRPTVRRSNSMYESDPYGNYYTESARDSRSRPAVHQEYRESSHRYPNSRQGSSHIPLGFYEVLDSSRSGKHASSSSRRRSASPLDAPQKTDEYDPDRRRLRSKTTTSKPRVVQQEAVSYGASPLESGSYGSHRTSDFSRAGGASMSASPPKAVHWSDLDPRRAQNHKIQSRQAKRESSVSAGVGTGDNNVKSILKSASPATETTSAPAVQPLTSDQYDAVYGRPAGQSSGGMAEDRESRDMIEGLRKRISGGEDRKYSAFDLPPRRFSGAWGEKASSSRGRGRSERFYDEGRREAVYY